MRAGGAVPVIRPLSTVLLLARTPITQVPRRLMGWFCIRGIGSLYYMSCARTHGADGAMAEAGTDVVGLTVSAIALSVDVRGVTAWYARSLKPKGQVEGGAEMQAAAG